MKDILKAYPFYLLPHHFISRIVYYFTRLEGRLVQPAIRKFSELFTVNLSEAKAKNINEFKTFNEFFTRELKAGVRPIFEEKNTLCCPVDGTVSQIGVINKGHIFQAKGHDYTVTELLGGNTTLSSMFQEGQFNTIYLSPKDYHRIHMPCDGTLTQQIHVPGRLFSVAPFTVNSIPRIFARNERVVAVFDTQYGTMVMVLVGAINVAAIETVWDGLVTPPKGKKITIKNYQQGEIVLKKGDEMGRFNMGSTIIWLMNNETLKWVESIEAGQAVKMGEAYMNV
jgi:phosphatidylserine decarboxylase